MSISFPHVPPGLLPSDLVVERELSGAGMSRVFVALDRRLNRRVVVKLLPPDLVSEASTQRFKREIAVTARLQHPNIIPILSSGSDGDVLFYTAPFIAGESLRERVARERALPTPDILRVLRDVCEALAFAHEAGVIHRDVKPGNILLSHGHALLADFGIARALTGDQITRTEAQPGTPAYMAPEQPNDHSADLYALGVVGYEMLTGRLPNGPVTVSSILSRRRGLQARIGLLEIGLARIIARAVAPRPAHRFASALELQRALENPTHALIRLRPTVRGMLVAGTAIALTIAAANGVLQGWPRLPPLSHSRLVVFAAPTSPRAEVARSSVEATAQRLPDVFAEWIGLDVVSHARASASLGEVRPTAMNARTAIAAARRLGAGQAIWLVPVVVGDSVRLEATLHDVAGDSVLRVRSLEYKIGSEPDIQSLRIAANALIRENDELPWRSSTDRSRPVLAAWRAYDSARVALENDDLRRAERLLRGALVADPRHAKATWYLARVLDWVDQQPNAQERIVLYRRVLAGAVTGETSSRDSALAEASVAMAEARYTDACRQFRALVRMNASNFDGWVGLGDCQRRDVEVVQAPTSSGFAFRTSYHSAASAYERAIESAPGRPPAFVFKRLSAVLFIEPNRMRVGTAQRSGRRFRAYPALVSDTVSFVPHPTSGQVSWRGIIPFTRARALEENALRLRRSFIGWTQASPGSAEAHRSLSEVLESLGNISESSSDGETGLAEVRRARALESDSLAKLSPIQIEVRQLLKNGDFAGARRLADSALMAWPAPPVEYVDFLVPLAALTGRSERLISYVRQLSSSPKYAAVRADGSPIPVPPAVARERAEALAAATLGLCDERVRGFEERMGRLLEVHVPDSGGRAAIRTSLIARPLSLAVPCRGPAAVIPYASESGDRLLKMQAAVGAGNITALRAHFDTLASQRRYSRPGDVAVDYTYAEAWLLAAAGDTAAALRRLELALDALPTMSFALTRELTQASGMVRAMILCARLAASQHDEKSARRWADAVVLLWSGADAALKPTLEEMRRLATP